MFGGILISVILVIMAGAHIATTLSTASELDKLRRKCRKLNGDIETLRSDNRVLYRQLSQVVTEKGALNKGPYARKVHGSLDLYHGGKVARVSAVFHPKN